MGNLDIEKIAIDFVIKYEKKQGRQAKRIPQGKGYDVLSKNRKIEVKGKSHEKPILANLNSHNVKAAINEKNWYLYVVYNIKNFNLKKGKIKLMIFNKSEINIRKGEEIHWKIPIRKDDLNNMVK